MEEERGISIGEIFKVIFRRVWWVVGAIAACMIIFVLVVQFYYNPNNKTYSTTFTIDYPDISSGLYPDGTLFRASDMIELSTLEAVQSLDDEFASIDVEKMSDRDDITISTEYEENNSTTTISYTITAHVNYFEDAKQALKFLRSLSAVPVNYVKTSSEDIDYALYLKSYDYATNFELRISLLNQEYNYITSTYSKFIELYGSGFSVKGKTLSNYITDLQTVYEGDRTSKLTSELNVGGYLYDLNKLEEENALLEAQKANLENRLKEATNQFNALYGDSTNISSFAGTALDSNIASFTDQIAIINNTLNARNATGNSDNAISFKDKNDKFSQKLDEYKSKLEAQATILKEVSSSLYSTQSKTVYTSNQVKTSGGLNIILAAIIGAVVGFIIAGVVICIIDMPKFIRERDAELSAQTQEKQAE
jgi:hypothetical protein